MTPDAEVVAGGDVGREEALGLASRSRSAPLGLLPAGRMLRDLGPVVRAAAGHAAVRQAKVPQCRAAGAKPVGDDGLRRETLSSGQLKRQLQRRLPVAPGLRDHLERLALVIGGAPQVVDPASDAHEDLVQKPTACRPWAPPPDPTGAGGAERGRPATHRLAGDIDAAFGEQSSASRQRRAKRGRRRAACRSISGGTRLRAQEMTRMPAVSAPRLGPPPPATPRARNRPAIAPTTPRWSAPEPRRRTARRGSGGRAGKRPGWGGGGFPRRPIPAPVRLRVAPAQTEAATGVHNASIRSATVRPWPAPAPASKGVAPAM